MEGFKERGGAYSSIPPANTVSHGGQMDIKPVRKEAGLRALFHQSTQCHTVVRWKALRKEAGLTAQRGTLCVSP